MLEQLKAAFALCDEGRLNEAGERFRAVLSTWPHSPDAWFGLGMVHVLGGDVDRAIEMFSTASERRPEDLAFRRALCTALEQSGRLVEAMAHWVRIGEQAPENARAFANMGRLSLKLGHREDALLAFRRQVDLDPEDYQGWLRMAATAATLGREDEAIAGFRQSIALRPALPQAHNELGRLLAARGQIAQAEQCYRRALNHAPRSFPALNNLANLMRRCGRFDEAARLYNRAQSLRPDDTAVGYNRALCLVDNGQHEAALAFYDAALQRMPESPRLWWGRTHAVPAVYDDTSRIPAEQQAFERRLTALEQRYDARRPGEQKAWFDSLLPMPELPAAELPLRRRYARLVRHVVADALPGWSVRRMMPAPRGGRLRVGFVSAYLTDDLLTYLFGGWMAAFAEAGDSVFVYQVSPRPATSRLASVATLRHLPGPTDKAADCILDDHLHALIFPEIGRNAGVYRLAAMRLAPLQLTTWGLPVTSGLSTIDAFLGAETLDPPGAEAQYSERLIRLSGLGLSPSRPEPSTGALPAGLDSGTIVALGQALRHYLPEQDELLVKLVRAVPDARLVFLRHPSATLTARFHDRLRARFTAAGLEPEDHLRFVPPRARGALYAAAHIQLDSISRSGAASTLDALAAGCPVVACAGPDLHRRIAAGFLLALGLPELIADDADALAALAIDLCRDPARREAVSAEIRARAPRLFNAPDANRAVVDAVHREVGGFRSRWLLNAPRRRSTGPV